MFVPLPVVAIVSPASVMADAIASVPTMVSRRSGQDGVSDYICRTVQADLCREVHRPAANPGAAAGELDTALRRACATMSGDYDAAVDIASLRDVGFEDTAQKDRAQYSVVHACRTAAGLGGVQITVVDNWTRYRNLPYREQESRLLGPREASFETSTMVVGYSPAAMQLRSQHRADERRETCRRNNRFTVREGVQTTSGLVVEVRERVALIQPASGPARWFPVDDLKPASVKSC